jgi:hypothetical protein
MTVSWCVPSIRLGLPPPVSLKSTCDSFLCLQNLCKTSTQQLQQIFSERMSEPIHQEKNEPQEEKDNTGSQALGRGV